MQDMFSDGANNVGAITSSWRWSAIGDALTGAESLLRRRLEDHSADTSDHDPRRLLLLVASEGRLPYCGFSTRRSGNDLDLVLFGLFGLSIAPLLTFGHVDLLLFDRDGRVHLDGNRIAITKFRRAGEVSSARLWTLRPRPDRA